MEDTNDEAAARKVSLTAIMDQKKVVHASTVAMQLASAAEQDRPKRKLAALMRPATGDQPITQKPSLNSQPVAAEAGHTNPQQHREGPPATQQPTRIMTQAKLHPSQQQKPLHKLSDRLQQLTESQATQAPSTAAHAAPQQRQSLVAKLQQLNHTASGTASASQQQQQQQQQQSSPSLKALTHPNWDRRSRAFRALDALAGITHAATSSTSAQGSGFSQGFASGQGLAPSTGQLGFGNGGVFGYTAAGSGGGWSRSAAAAGSGRSSMAAGAEAMAAVAADSGVTVGTAAEEQWDKELADRAADMLWEEDDQQLQQQQRKKRSRQQQGTDAPAPATVEAAAAGVLGYSRSAAGSGSSRQAAKRQRPDLPAAAAAAAAQNIPDGIRDALLAEDATLPLNPTVGGLATGGSIMGLGLGDTDADQGPPAEPLELVDPKSCLHLQVPGSINRHLRSYQREGVQFLFQMYCKGRGGVLSDDMGLGKTVQAISFLAALLGKTGTMADALPRSYATTAKQKEEQQAAAEAGAGAAGSVVRWPALVVAPTSVLDNWIREFNMWGHFKVAKYSSSNASHIQQQAALSTLEVILTSYDQLRINPDDILGLNPHVVIFDEAHRLKNSKSRVYEAVRRGLKTKFRYGLSGTIMPNNHEELWSVLDILVPGCLGDYKEYSDYYGKPIRKGQSRTARQWEIRKGAERLSQLQELLQKVYLRRTKAIIADQLPKKKDNIVFCQLKPLQYRAYDRTLASPDLQVLQRSREPCDCGSGLLRGQCCYDTVPPEFGGVLWPHYHMCNCSDPDCKRHRPEGCAEYYRQQGRENVRIVCPNCLMLPAISLLQKISNHLDLIRPDAKLAEQDEQQFEYQLRLARMVLGNDASALGGLVSNSGGWLGASDETHCGKMATLQALLSKWSCERSQHNKVLIFSHSTRCLDLLEKFVQRAGYDYVRLDGSTAQKQRQMLVDEFNTRQSIFLFLMSTLAGGVGLNLTAANKVVVFDPSWNPSNDLQAQDRAYRLGQTRDVEVYRLVGTGTLEELVYRRQIYKQQQANMVLENKQEARYFEGVQGDKDKQGELWGLQNLLRFSGHTIETRDILNAYQEGSRERQRLERQLQQQQERVQQGRLPAAAAAAAADSGEGAARPAAAAGGGKGSVGYEIVEVQDLADVPDDPNAAAAAKGGAAAPSTLITDVLDIDNLQQAPEFLEGDEAAAVVGLAEPAVKQSKQQQQRGKGRLRRRTAQQQPDADLDGEMQDSGDSGMQQDNPQQYRRRQRQLGDADNDDPADSAGGVEGAAAGLQSPAAAGGGVGGGVGEGTQVMDSLVMALQDEGVILHMHTHDSVLGRGEKVPHRRQGTSGVQQLAEQQQQQDAKRSKLELSAATADPDTICRAAAEDPRAAAAARVSAAVLAATKAAADQGHSIVASLSVWQQMPVADVAQLLLQLNSQERRELVVMYAADMAVIGAAEVA